MDDETLFSFRISQEALAELLQLAGIGDIAGFAVDPFADGPPARATALRAAARRALLAHGYAATTPDGDLVIDETLRRLLSFCQGPQGLLVLASRQMSDTAVQVETYYLFGETTVQQYLPFAGVHEFAMLATRPPFADRITDRLLQVSAAEAKRPLRLHLPQAIMGPIQQSMDDDQVEAARMQLAVAGVPAADATLLLTTMAAPRLRLFVQATTAEPVLTSRALTILCDAQHCWLIQDVDAGDEEQLAIELVGAAALRHSLQQVLSVLSPEPELQ